MIPKITLKDLPFYQEQGAILIDVRDPMEYQMGHLPNAYNIPYDHIIEGTKKYLKDTPMVLYCSSGTRSRMAAHLLNSMGYTHVYDLGKVSF